MYSHENSRTYSTSSRNTENNSPAFKKLNHTYNINIEESKNDYNDQEINSNLNISNKVGISSPKAYEKFMDKIKLYYYLKHPSQREQSIVLNPSLNRSIESPIDNNKEISDKEEYGKNKENYIIDKSDDKMDHSKIKDKYLVNNFMCLNKNSKCGKYSTKAFKYKSRLSFNSKFPIHINNNDYVDDKATNINSNNYTLEKCENINKNNHSNEKDFPHDINTPGSPVSGNLRFQNNSFSFKFGDTNELNEDKIKNMYNKNRNKIYSNELIGYLEKFGKLNKKPGEKDGENTNSNPCYKFKNELIIIDNDNPKDNIFKPIVDDIYSGKKNNENKV